MGYSCKALAQAMKAAVMLGALALIGRTAMAQSVQYQIFILTVGDSPQSNVLGVMFDGQYIWATVQNPDGGVLVKLTRLGSLLSSTSVGANPDKLAYDGTNVWVTDFSSNSVSVVSPAGLLLNTIALPASTSPANPEGIVFDGQYIWVANDGPGANSVTKLDAKSQTVVATYPVGRTPDAVAFDGSYIWVANSYSANVWKLDRDTGQMVGGYVTGLFPTDMVYDGTNMWVSNGYGASLGLGSVTKIRAADGAPQGTFSVGMQVRGSAFDGKSIWVCNSASNTISRLRASSVTLMGEFPTGKGPRSAAFDGQKIWVANSGQNTLTIIAPPDFQAAAVQAAPQLALSAGALIQASMGVRAPVPAGAVTPRAAAPAGRLLAMLQLLLDDE